MTAKPLEDHVCMMVPTAFKCSECTSSLARVKMVKMESEVPAEIGSGEMYIP